MVADKIEGLGLRWHDFQDPNILDLSRYSNFGTRKATRKA
ncbi:unnamed protein product [marine sediment metagenome]|uniref:Uncharacterized protein n=1 Tax=marine sediment metagenome TaxID=412755 RepID=X1E593_9ZZZZ